MLLHQDIIEFDDSRLPRWLKFDYNEKTNSMIISGTPT